MRNVRVSLAFPVLLWMSDAHAQDPVVQSIINAVSVDSLMNDLGLLTGEAPIDVGNGPEIIVSRNKNQPGNPLAADWLQYRFQQMGFTPAVQVFSGGTGENILVEKPGVVHPERKVVICGHYDSMPGGPVASPAADDDGSGTVAVLEALRVMASYDFENTIVFALWDEEEQGKLGSIYYAGVAAASDVEITAVVNMDAIAYDGDGDGLMRVHTKNIANSIALKDTAMMVNSTYAGLQLPMAINLPGATYSDHASFWTENYSAILIIEDFDNDGNPHYHTSTDLVDYVDQPYFQGLTRLGIGTAAVMARPLAVETLFPPDAPVQSGPSLFVHPNPASGTTMVRTGPLAGNVSLVLYDAMGRQVMDIANGSSPVGRRLFSFDAQGLAPGSYVLHLTAGDRSTSVIMVRTP